MIKTNELYSALRRLNRQMYRVAHRKGRGKDGLYQGQESLLILILQNDGASQRDLAEQLDVRPSSMTEMLTKLKQHDLILRKQDETDQRVVHIHLTEAGRVLAESLAEGKDTFTKSFFCALTEEEQEQLFVLINKLCAGLEATEDTHGKIHHKHGAAHHLHDDNKNGIREHRHHERKPYHKQH